MTRFEIRVSHWAARAGSLKSPRDFYRWLQAGDALDPVIAPERVAGVSPMALRRTTRLGNAAVAIGRELLDKLPDDRPLSVVTVSELGELQTNDLLIENVVEGAAMSPQKFSASVHNHVLGQLCIHLGLPCPGGASTGAASGLEMGMIEAVSELATGRSVLFFAFEPRVDEHYARWLGGESPEHMVGLLLQADAPVRLILERGDQPTHRAAGATHALDWLAVLSGARSTFAGPDGWHWRHVAA